MHQKLISRQIKGNNRTYKFVRRMQNDNGKSKMRWFSFRVNKTDCSMKRRKKMTLALHKRFYYVCINGIKIEMLQERIISAVRPRTFKQKF